MLTTSSCGSDPDGDDDVVDVQKCRCMMQTCSLAHWRQPYVCALKAEKAAPDVLGCGVRKFRNLIFVSLFAQAFRSQEETQESTTPYLLKLSACNSAIASVLTFVGMFACI